MQENAPASMKSSSEPAPGNPFDRAADDARKGAAALKARAGDFADSQKKEVSESLSEFAGAIEKASEDLRGKDQTMAAQLLQEAAGGLGQLSRSISGTAPAELVSSVRDFGRKNPVAFIGGAVLAGLALGRFARAAPPSTSGPQHAGGLSSGRPASHGPESSSDTGGSRQGSGQRPASMRAGSSSDSRSAIEPAGESTIGTSMLADRGASKPSSMAGNSHSDTTRSLGSFASESVAGVSAASATGGSRNTKSSIPDVNSEGGKS